MIPTVIGVIIITFVLFNVVGGSPAAMKLGKHASPESLEEFDETRGYNRPLIFGRWIRTRALGDTEFGINAGAWNQIPDIMYREPSDRLPGRLGLPPGRDYPIPLAFSLRSGTAYRLTMEYRTADGSEVQFVVRNRHEPNQESVSIPLPETRGWSKVKLPIATVPDGHDPELFIRVSNTDMELKSVQLRRRVENPLQSQLVYYFMQILHADFGTSTSTNQRVSSMLLEGILPSLMLTVPIFFVGLVVSISLSLICAIFRNQFVDRFFVVMAVALMSINYLIFIILGQYILGYRMQWFPIWGFESWRFILLPVLIGVVSGLGGSLRFYRTIMLDEMYRDYVRTAFAKGAGKTRVLFKHVLKNAMVPIVTNVVIAIPFLYTGSLLLETFFGIPGLGYIAINAINSSDVDVIRAIVLIGSVSFVLANFLTDMCYLAVDPRVKLK